MGVAAEERMLWLLLPAPPRSHPFAGSVSGGFPQKPQHQAHVAGRAAPRWTPTPYSPEPETLGSQGNRSYGGRWTQRLRWETTLDYPGGSSVVGGKPRGGGGTGEPVSVTRHERGHRSLWSEGGAMSQGMRELSRRQERQAAGSPPLETGRTEHC